MIVHRSLAVAIVFLTVALLSGPLSAQSGKAQQTQEYTVLVSQLNGSLESPWGMAFLPDGRLLITQKAGTMVILSADGRRIERTVGRLPAVADAGQGGLMDVILDPDFKIEPWVYWSYAESGTMSAKGRSGTAVARGLLRQGVLQNITVIYRQTPKVEGYGHFGSRLVFGRDGMLYITLGERQKFTPAQDMTQSLGKVVRINKDGSLPKDNPRWKAKSALPEIYSLGHRNPQGAAVHPATGALWISEHGPQGGDEINRIEAGKNYGWPLASYGCNYGQPVGAACRLGGGRHSPAFVEPLSIWEPISMAPSGMLFYTGAMFPAWEYQVLVGALAGKALWRIQYRGDKEVVREKMLQELGERIRDVEQGPGGAVYLITDSGKLFRLTRLK